jgi:transposase
MISLLRATICFANRMLSDEIPIVCLPAYSPDLSPIEHAFSKIKQALRRAKAQTVDALIDAIAHALDTISWADTLGWFTSCGFLNLA